MNELHLKALLSGILFGVWPLLMNRSGLIGNVAAGAFSLGCSIAILPFALHSIVGGQHLANSNWLVVFLAASMLVCSIILLLLALPPETMRSSLAKTNWLIVAAAVTAGALGLLAFNSVMFKATRVQAPALFVLMLVIQISVPALYQAFITGGITLARGFGFVTAVITALLLM